MKTWGARALIAVAVLLGLWFAAFWYFGAQENELRKARSKVGELLTNCAQQKSCTGPLLKSYRVDPDGTVDLILTGHAELEGVRVSMVPVLEDRRIVSWRCQSDAATPHLPASCRKTRSP